MTLKERLQQKVQNYLSEKEISKREELLTQKKQNEELFVASYIEKYWKEVESKFEDLSPEDLINGSIVKVYIASFIASDKITEGIKEKAENKGLKFVDKCKKNEWITFKFEVSN